MADFSAGLYLIIVGGKINKTFSYEQKMSIRHKKLRFTIRYEKTDLRTIKIL